MAEQMSAENVRTMLAENLDRLRKANAEYFQMLEKGAAHLPVGGHAKQYFDLMQRNVTATFDLCDKLIQAKAHGAIVLEVAGNFSDAYREAERIRAQSSRWANLTSTYLNPYMTAAHATIFYELWSALGRVGTVLVPIGAGPMLDGIVQGALTLEREGLIDAVPVPVGVQGKGCAPIADAFAKGRDTVEAWTAPVTGIPGSINDPLRGYPDDGTRTLRVRTSRSAVAAFKSRCRLSFTTPTIV